MTASQREKEILEFWDQENIFRKSVDERPESTPYVFYDGPPFATGLPHYGNLPSSFLKDAIPRYKMMRGFRVNRVWGWDCHGLPIENIIEKKLELKSKKDIESYGIGNFNEQCRDTVLMYAEEWKKIIRRVGRWVDMEHAYKTMDLSYMESVWWVFSELWKKGLITEGKKAMHICPRCATPLSNFEVTQGYQDVKDISATVTFRLSDAKEKLGLEGDVFLLAWTTTPWTLPGNVLLALAAEVNYRVIQDKESGAQYIISADRWSEYAKKIVSEKYTETEKVLKGSALAGMVYEPLFPYFAKTKNAFRVVTASFVNTAEGTGVVHIAPAFGDDDYALGVKENVEFVQHVGMDGRFTADVIDFSGQEVKPKDDPTKTDIDIIKWLAKHGSLFYKEKFLHSYPHCWRCDTPLLNYATSSWFVAVPKLRDELLVNNAKTSWVPATMRDGRFGKWLEGAREWAISRNRFWGTPLPVWKSEDGEIIVVGSVAELESLSGSTIIDLHKHVVDDIVITKDGKRYRRIPEVLDCWFESGAMPYAQLHYPFENKNLFERGFPAEFIAEGQDQTRGWFYTLHVLATALTRAPQPSLPLPPSSAFKNVIVNGIVLAEDGKKMSKRLKNYPDIMGVIEAYGADAMRFYILSSPVVHAENLNFSENGVREVANKFGNTLRNVLVFYQTFHGERATQPSPHVLDRWILSRLAQVRSEVTVHLDAYELAQSCRVLLDFASELSQWYVRRSRDRFKSDDAADRQAANRTFTRVLSVLSRLIAPITPFIAEDIHQTLKKLSPEAVKELSVHLEAWPEKGDLYDGGCEEQMAATRQIVERAHALRAAAKIKVRQPLRELQCTREIGDAYCRIISEEVNVKKVTVQKNITEKNGWVSDQSGEWSIALDTALDESLAQEGLARELVRLLNSLRKERNLSVNDAIQIRYATDDNDLKQTIARERDTVMKQVIATSLQEGEEKDMAAHIVNGRTIRIAFIH